MPDIRQVDGRKQDARMPPAPVIRVESEGAVVRLSHPDRSFRRFYPPMPSMLPRLTRRGLAVLLGALVVCASVQAQPQPTPKSARKAFVLSLLLPGLGHRYVHGGSWDGAATFFAGVEAGTWLGLAGNAWWRDQVVEGYRALAATRAGADVEGKDRQFFLNLATYRSSDEYLDVQLRARNWSQLDYVSDPSFQWSWATESDFLRFRDQREKAESMRRRRTFLISVLAGNRLIAALTALRATNRASSALGDAVSLSLAVPPAEAKTPVVQMRVRL